MNVCSLQKKIAKIIILDKINMIGGPLVTALSARFQNDRRNDHAHEDHEDLHCGCCCAWLQSCGPGRIVCAGRQGQVSHCQHRQAESSSHQETQEAQEVFS